MARAKRGTAKPRPVGQGKFITDKPAPKPSGATGYAFSKADLSKGGATSKRGPSIRKQLERFLVQTINPAITKALKQNKIMLPDGTLVPAPVRVYSTETAEAIALNLIAAALKNEPWAIKLITEQIDGKAKETVAHTVESNTSIMFEVMQPPGEKDVTPHGDTESESTAETI